MDLNTIQQLTDISLCIDLAFAYGEILPWIIAENHIITGGTKPATKTVIFLLQFSISALRFSRFQRQPNQPIRFIRHKQRNVQHIIIQFQILQ